MKIAIKFSKLYKNLGKKLTKCKCSKNGTVHRMVSSSGFRLKGSGWYETDFKTKKSDTKNGNIKYAKILLWSY